MPLVRSSAEQYPTNVVIPQYCVLIPTYFMNTVSDFTKNPLHIRPITINGYAKDIEPDALANCFVCRKQCSAVFNSKYTVQFGVQKVNASMECYTVLTVIALIAS